MRRILLVVVVVVLLGAGYSAWALSRPLPVLQPHDVLSTLPAAQPVQLPWPGFGEAALGADGYGVLGQHGSGQPMPTASTAKLITALAVLHQKPLKPGEQGPSLTIGDNDLQYYDNYVAQQGSVVPVNFGEQITERQALEALLLPSANNMAESLAVWAFGSMPAYTTYANTFVRQLGMSQTHVADASGFSPDTTSTAPDLVRLGIAAIQNPALAQIAAEKQAVIPVAGTIYNVNRLLGSDGINGLKTGNTDQDGGVFVASGTYTLSGHAITIVTAIMGGSTLSQALQAAPPLLAAAQQNFTQQKLVHKGEIVGYYNTPWHTSANAVAAGDIAVFGWKAQAPKLALSLQTITAGTAAGKQVGTIRPQHTSASLQQVAATLQQPVSPPSWRWRLLHP